MNIKKQVQRLPYDMIEITYTNVDTWQTERKIVDVKPWLEEAALKYFDLELMKRFKDLGNPG